MSYVKHTQRHCQTSEPSRSCLQKPGQFLDAAVMKSVPGNGIPALGGQWFTQPRVIPGSISSTASDLSNTLAKKRSRFKIKIRKKKYIISKIFYTSYSFLDYSQDKARRFVLGVVDKIIHGSLDDGLNLTVVRRVIKNYRSSG